MKKFNTENLGGHPLTLNDIRHVQDSAREMFEVILKSLSNQTDLLVVSGLITSGSISQRTWTSGWLFYQNEIFFVDELTLETDFSDFGFNIVEFGDSDDPTLYADGGSHNVRVVRKLVPIDTVGGTIPSLFPVDGAFNLKLNERISENLIENGNLTNKLESKRFVKFGNYQDLSTFNTTDWNQLRTIQAKLIDDVVVLSGEISPKNITTNSVGVLPSEFRPQQGEDRKIILINSATQTTLIFRVSNNGNIYPITNTGIGVLENIIFDSATYRKSGITGSGVSL